MTKYTKLSEIGSKIGPFIDAMWVLNQISCVPRYRFTFPKMELKNFFGAVSGGTGTEPKSRKNTDQAQLRTRVDMFNRTEAVGAANHGLEHNDIIVEAIRRFVDSHFGISGPEALTDYLFPQKEPPLWSSAALRYLGLQRLWLEATVISGFITGEVEGPPEYKLTIQPLGETVVAPFHELKSAIGEPVVEKINTGFSRKDIDLVLNHLDSRWHLVLPDLRRVSPRSILQAAVGDQVIDIESTRPYDFLSVLNPSSYFSLIATLSVKYDGRVRICEICDRGYWAYFSDQNACSTKCSNTLSQRQRRLKSKGLRYPFRVVWLPSDSTDNSFQIERNQQVHKLANQIQDDQEQIRKLTPSEVKRLKQRWERRTARKKSRSRVLQRRDDSLGSPRWTTMLENMFKKEG